MKTTIHSIATANPEFSLPQAQAAEFMVQVDGISPALRRRIPGIYENSAIDRRYSCISDYGSDPANFQFYPKNWALSPVLSTETRNRAYLNYAPNLAIDAARQALQQAHFAAQDITHLIVVSCTGFAAPGVEIQMIQQLNLRSTVARTAIGFMGCHGALNGLKIAHAICQTDPSAIVLMVCVELCTLHIQIADSIESVVTNALFSDGAAAVILSTQAVVNPGKSLVYCGGNSQILPDSQALMNWTIGDTGFLMGLSPKVADHIATQIERYMDDVLKIYQLHLSDLDFWAIHPGGIQIIRQVQSAIDIPQSKIQDSYDILHDYGNMSSPTILFILKRILHRLQQADESRAEEAFGRTFGGTFGTAIAFGPGLTIESALFEVV